MKIPLILIILFNNFNFNQAKASQNNPEKFNFKEKVDSIYDENTDYILDSGDTLAIIFNGLDNFGSNYAIRTDGGIIIPEINRLFVKGLTIKELEEVK